MNKIMPIIALTIFTLIGCDINNEETVENYRFSECVFHDYDIHVSGSIYCYNHRDRLVISINGNSTINNKSVEIVSEETFEKIDSIITKNSTVYKNDTYKIVMINNDDNIIQMNIFKNDTLYRSFIK